MIKPLAMVHEKICSRIIGIVAKQLLFEKKINSTDRNLEKILCDVEIYLYRTTKNGWGGKKFSQVLDTLKNKAISVKHKLESRNEDGFDFFFTPTV